METFSTYVEATQHVIPQIYDIDIDAYRDATQSDIDRLQRLAAAYHKLRTTVMAQLNAANRLATNTEIEDEDIVPLDIQNELFLMKRDLMREYRKEQRRLAK